MTTLLAACLALLPAQTPPQPIIKVKVNDKEVTFPDVGPRRIGGRVMIPVRGVFEAMGAEIRWLAAEAKVVAMKGSRKVELIVGQRMADVNGIQVRLDQPSRMIEERVFIPLRFVGESLGGTVDYDGPTRTVNVKITEDPQTLRLATRAATLEVRWLDTAFNIPARRA